MLIFIQKMLELSMRLDKSSYAILRLFGKVTGFFPVWYSRRLERKLFNGTWNPHCTKASRRARRLRRRRRK